MAGNRAFAYLIAVNGGDSECAGEVVYINIVSGSRLVPTTCRLDRWDDSYGVKTTWSLIE